jgi:hypothetical protein
MYKSFRKTQRKRFLTILSAFLILATLPGLNMQAQEDGKQLFQPCAACHTIGGGKLIGPDLKGITERLDRDWLKRFINNSTEVINSGDEYAVKLFEEYNKIPMLLLNLQRKKHLQKGMPSLKMIMSSWPNVKDRMTTCRYPSLLAWPLSCWLYSTFSLPGSLRQKYFTSWS